MTTTLTHTATPTAVDFDTRLELAALGMDVRLDQAALAFAVNTAHLPDTVVDLTDVPLQPMLAPAVTPIAAVLRDARSVLAGRGWTRGGLRDEQGAVCLGGAIRVAAGPDRGLADDACAIVLDAIRRQFTAETLPSWNDQQASAGPVIRILGAAADQATNRRI